MAEELTPSLEPLDRQSPAEVASPNDSPAGNAPEKTAFELAAQEPRLSLAREFLIFLKEEKKWWLLPILITLGLVALVAFLAGSPVAPFIYPLF